MKKGYFFLFAFVFVLASCGGTSTDGAYVVYSSSSATASSTTIGNTIGSPTSLKQTFYTAWISINEDCSDAVLLQDHGDAGKEIDFYNGDLIFSGSPADGTYKCIIIKSSDIQYFIPDAVAIAAWTHCSDTTYTEDLFKTDAIAPYMNKDGSFITGDGTYTAPVAQITYSYLTTNPEAIIALGASSQQVITLESPLIVPGQGTFYTDFSNQVGEAGPEQTCWLEQPVVGFR